MKTLLKSFNIFSDREINEFIELGVQKTLSKGDFYIKEGSVCRKMAFVVSGIFRNYYYSSSGDEITYCISFPNSFITAYSSFITQNKTQENIQALSDAEILVFSKLDMDRLEKTNKNWLCFSKKIAEKQYMELEKRIFLLQKEKSEARYSDMLNNHPEYIQKIPLQYLASYLGITQRHLSRLRKNISK